MASPSTAPANPEARHIRRSVINIPMPSLGKLDGLMGDDKIHDILVNGLDVYVDLGGKLVASGVQFDSHEEVWSIVEEIIHVMNLRWSEERPLLDTRLPDGSRVNIVGPPVSIDGMTISIRKFPKENITLDTMIAKGQLSPEIAIFLSECVQQRLNIVVSGGTGAGKTTLLNALSAAISMDERVVTIEDAAELRLQQPHVVRLETKIGRAAGVSSVVVNEISTRDLVRNALRMRPDRIILGESRGGEAFDVLQAMNTGHHGSMTTLHANGPRDAISRLEMMVLIAMPQLTGRIVRHQIASSVNLIIQMVRNSEGTRVISHISEISGMEGEVVILQDIMAHNQANQTAASRWNFSIPRNPVVAEAARRAGMMKALR